MPLQHRQLEIKLISVDDVDYTLKVGEKQFADVGKVRKSRESKIEVCCSWFAGPGLAYHAYFAAPSLHVQSAPRNSIELRIL